MLLHMKRKLSLMVAFVLLITSLPIMSAEAASPISGGDVGVGSEVSGSDAGEIVQKKSLLQIGANGSDDGIVLTSDEVVLLNNGSRLVADKDASAYKWQISTAVDGSFTDISDETKEYYDITANDENRYIRVMADGVASEPVGPIGKLVVFDLAMGAVSLGATYSGKATDGSTVSGTHVATNIYVIQQSNNGTLTVNGVAFSGNLADKPFDVTLDGVNMGKTSYGTAVPGSGGHLTDYDKGMIHIPATSDIKKVTLRLKGENIVRGIHYNTQKTTTSSLKITDINGDGATDGGSLYVPEKVKEEDIVEFVKKSTGYNHWNSGIGGDDGTGTVSNLHLAGGKIQVLTTYGDNCSAIGAGGNDACSMLISGGEIIAHCNGTGAAIGGGIGWNSAGGTSDIVITGGKIYAKNHGEIYIKDGKITDVKEDCDEMVGGVAIGSGSSFHKSGSEGKVTITGGTVEAYGTFGNGIGGGNSSTSTGGKATVIISGGKVTATSIGGGNSKKGVGGSANVTISQNADVTLINGIGGGKSDSGDGGEADITMTNGTLQCGGVIGGGNGSLVGNGGAAVINVSGGTLTALSIGGGIGGTQGNGGAAEVEISGGTIETGSIGGGSTLNPTGKLGYAKANISGGDISGQFLMAAGGTEPCTFSMNGGTLHGVHTGDTSKYTYVQKNGAAVYMDDPDGVASLSGGLITDCSAEIGGAVYMTAGTFTISGTGAIDGCEALEKGGAVYLGGGLLTVAGGSIKENSAVDGGGIYLANGTMNVTDGEIVGNIAENSGGGALVNGGNVTVTGGAVTNNQATENGGGIAVNNGNYTMTGGKVDYNQSLQGSGGGIYVSADGSDVTVEVLSGSVSYNKAQRNGGALSVVGKAEGTEQIDVTIGVNEVHFDENGQKITCEHGAPTAVTCPVIVSNTAKASGGAIYVTGNDHTSLNIYCLEESANVAEGDKAQSNFMKVEGGKVIISTTEVMDEASQTAQKGNVQIVNTIYVTGGQMDIWGEMTNPRIQGIITVDITRQKDYFLDHRSKKEYYKLLYYENFTDPITGVVTGQYKEKEIKMGCSETIDGNIYVHPGYNIIGWNTDSKGAHNYPQGFDTQAPTQGWYDVGSSYLFDGNPIGDLIIYAIWEANGYTVIYDPNVPVDENYTGKMENQIFKYDIPIQLNKNEYGRIGYTFVGWSRNQDGSGVRYKDQELVNNLTSEKGEVVTLYAQWEKCDHDPQTHKYTYSVIDDGATLKRDCSCGGYSETAALAAQDTVYDRSKHPAQVVYSASEQPAVTNWQPSVTYEKTDDATHQGIPVNAGNYTASVSDGDCVASVNYTIEKAQQPAPEKPIEFTAVVNQNKSSLKIKSIADSPLKEIDDTYNSVKQYQIVYYVNDERYATEWVDEADLGDGYAASYDLDVALTNYYVYARYSEGSNYKASPETAANSVYFFAGDVQLFVDSGEGVFYVPKEAGVDQGVVQGITITVTVEAGYYFPDGYENTITIVTKDENGNLHTTQALLTSVMNKNGTEYVLECSIEGIPSKCSLHVKLPDAKKIPTIEAQVEEKQIFGNVTGDVAYISRDSAYTAYFEVMNYDTASYEGLNLEFTRELPEGTSLIMIDKKSNNYYYMIPSVGTTSVNLKQFVLMGSGAGAGNGAETSGIEYAVAENESDLKLQFVVDFSSVTDGISGGHLTTTLTLVNKSGISDQLSRVPVQIKKSVRTHLADVSDFELEVSGEGLTKTISYEYTPFNGFAVSKWDNRDAALVLIPITPLPSDTHVVYADIVYTTVTYGNNKGAFVIPLSEVGSGEISVTLISDLFPEIRTEYKMDVTLMMAESIAETSPTNGVKVCADSLTFVSGDTMLPSVKVVGDKRLYEIADTVKSVISWFNISSKYTVSATLMRKSDDGKYGSTGWEKKNITDGNTSPLDLSVPLGGQSKGSYCLQVTVMQGVVKITDAFYYFIVQ